MYGSLKRFTEKALLGAGIGRLAFGRTRGRTLVLAYHNILPEGEHVSGDSSLHLPQREFSNQLDAIAQSHEVVGLDTLLDGKSYTDAPRVIITFDDAYQGAVTAGLDELVKRRMPATIFVSPALLGQVTWWDALAQPRTGTVPAEVRQRALQTFGGRSEAVVRWARSKPLALHAESTLPRIATEAQLLTAAKEAGVSFGSHTWSHSNLTALSIGELEAELARPLEWLEASRLRTLPVISYPYGLFDHTVAKAAKRAGYRAAFRIDGGYVPRPPFSRFEIPRLNVPAGLSIEGFRLRLAGIGAGG